MTAEDPAPIAGGGAMGERVRAFDWSATPLGPIRGWPACLRTAASLVLASPFPSVLLWGPGLAVAAYNDAYRPLLGSKPEALGRPHLEVWAEIRAFITHQLERARAGETISVEGARFTLLRNSEPEEAWFDYGLSPVRDEAGRVAGVLNTAVETTAKVRAERRQAFLLHLEERLRGLADPHEVALAAAEALGRRVGAARAGCGGVDAAGETVAVARDWTDGTVASLAGEARLLDAFGPAVIAELRAGRTLVVEDCLTDPRAAGEGHAATWSGIGTRSLVVVPLLRAGRLVAIFYVHEPRPRRWSTTEVGLAEDAAHRAWAAVERARAEAALRESEERLRFLDRLGEATARASAPREVMAITAGLLGRHLRVTRCAYADVDADGDRFTIRDDWTDGAPGSAGEYSLDLFGSRAAADMRAGRTLVVRDVAGELPAGDGGGTFSAIGIAAIVCCPLVKEGRLVAMMAVHQSSPRDWAGAEVALLETVVERAWAHIERVRAEAALRESEERFRRMADAVPQIVWITDAEGRVEFFNEQWFAFTGASRGAATAAGVAADFVHPDDAAPTMERFEEARRTGGTFLVEHRIRSRDGEYRWFLVRGEPQRDPRGGGILRWYGASVDIHDRRRAEAALREREERLRLIVEGARDYAIFTTDAGGLIDSWMPGAANVFGLGAEEAVGRPAAITFTPEDREAGEPQRELETARREGAAPDVRWHQRKDGSRVFIEGSVTALRGAAGGVRGFLKIGQDVTARRAAEEARALLAREVDHRAKNALTVVQTMLRLTRADDVPSFARAVEGRVAALARAQTLLAEGRWDGADLHAMLRGELAPFLAGQRAELDGPPVVLPPGTAQPLAMAAHELATNAAKHGALSVPEGRVSVSWRLDGGAPCVLRLRWAEGGGPPVAGPPARRGFGSRVLEGTVRGQLGGAVSLAWGTAGLVCEMEVPLGRGPARVEETDPDGAAAG